MCIDGGITVGSEDRLIELFLQKYSVCFDDKHEVKACGRNFCSELIAVCEDLGKKIGKIADYGNMSTGLMNVNNIQELYKEVSNV